MARRYGKTPRQYRREVAREEADKARTQAYNYRLGRYHDELRRTSSPDDVAVVEQKIQDDFIATFDRAGTPATRGDDATAQTLIAMGIILGLIVVAGMLFSFF